MNPWAKSLLWTETKIVQSHLKNLNYPWQACQALDSSNFFLNQWAVMRERDCLSPKARGIPEGNTKLSSKWGKHFFYVQWICSSVYFEHLFACMRCVELSFLCFCCKMLLLFISCLNIALLGEIMIMIIHEMIFMIINTYTVFTVCSWVTSNLLWSHLC